MKMPACAVKNSAIPTGDTARFLPEASRNCRSSTDGMVAMRATVQNAITAVSSQ